LSQKLTQRRAVIAPAQQRLKRMLVGIETGQGRDPQQGGKKQGLKAPPQRLLAVMQQREVIVGLGALMGLDGLSELGDNRAKSIVLVEPMGKEMHAHTRQMRCDLDDCCARTNRTAPCGSTGAAFSPIQVPLCPQPIEMANAHHNRDLTLSDLVEYYTAWTLRVLMEDLPHQGHLHDAQLSPSLKRWT